MANPDNWMSRRIGVRNLRQRALFHADWSVTEVTYRVMLYCGSIEMDEPYDAQIDIPLQVQEMHRLSTFRMLRIEYTECAEFTKRLPDDAKTSFLGGDMSLERSFGSLPNPRPRDDRPFTPYCDCSLRVPIASLECVGVRGLSPTPFWMFVLVRSILTPLN